MTDNLPVLQPAPISAAQQQHIVNMVRRTARAEIMPRFRRLSPTDIKTKSGPADLVTQADTAAEAMITRALKIAFPDALIVGEEAVAADPGLPAQIADAPLAFIIDPVDGTWNFAHGLALFGVILAVTQFGRPVFGMIYDPVGDDWVIADGNGDARLERPGGFSHSLQASSSKPLAQMTGHIPLQLFKGDSLAKMAAVLPQFARTEPLRCSAHEYRLVAQGYSDFMLSAQLSPWDHAAGALICERAGAHVEMLDGGPYTAARLKGHLLVAPDQESWNRLKEVFSFLTD